jgi:hypothetical protein
LRFVEARQHRLDPGHLLCHDTLEVEQGGALRRQRSGGRLDGLHRSVDLREDRARRLRRHRGSSRLLPGRLDLFEMLQRSLEESRPVREELEPLAHPELPLLPQLLLRLDRVERRLIPPDALGSRQVAVHLLAQLGETLPDRDDLGAGSQRLRQGPQELRHLRRLRSDLVKRDRGRGRCHRRRRFGRRRRRGLVLCDRRRHGKTTHDRPR